MIKILITGSKGVIGSQLVKSLLNKKAKVYGLDLVHDPLPSNYSRCDISEGFNVDLKGR